MKRVLITGACSCVGMCIEKWLNQWPEKYFVDSIDMKDDSWRKHDFSSYDSVYHVAGIAHIALDSSMESLFYRVNRDLPIETAMKAKQNGVKQFIFMSSGIIYGDSSHIGKEFTITIDTKPNPANFYGDSKLQAEQGIMKLEDENFKIVIIRSPALYGLGMKSHYNNLSWYARKFPIFLNIRNTRSMLYNKNLAEFVRLMIENEERGIFWPQNAEYTCTAQLIKDIAIINKKTMFLISGFEWLFKIIAKFSPAIDKAFGSFAYEKELSEYKENYRIVSYKDSIEEIEKESDSLLIEKLM